MFKVLVLQPNKAQSPVLVLGAFFTREEVFDYSTLNALNKFTKITGR